MNKRYDWVNFVVQIKYILNTKKIGHTPLDRCDYLSDKYRCEIYIKKEFFNPSKSAKDRPALHMINTAIENQQLKPGDTIVEASSGNTGIAIAYYARIMGYKAVIYVSQSCSKEKLDELSALEAEVVVCANSNGISDQQSTQYRARQYADTHKNAFYTDQYNNDSNFRSHLTTTGPEIWEQTHQRITHFFGGLGTGGTLRGVGTFLKKQNSAVEIVGIEPVGSVLSHFKTYGKMPNWVPVMDKISGIGRTFVPGVFDPQVLDRILQVRASRAKELAETYFKETGNCVGFSSAAVLCGLEDYMQQTGVREHSTVVLLFADHGTRYKELLYSHLNVDQTEDYANT